MASQQAFAQGNDLYGPAGGRAALMGNTGVALARDGAAPLYNPATIVRVRDERLAFSANFYSFAIASFADWHQPNGVDRAEFGNRRLANTGLVTSDFHLPPSTLCLFFTLEELVELSSLDVYSPAPSDRGARQKLAVCFATLESEDVDLQALQFQGQTQAGPTTQVQSLQRRWNRAYLGPTYSVQVNEDLALGGSLQVVYSYTSFGLHGTSLSSTLGGGGAATSLSTSGRGRTFGVAAFVGGTYRYRRLHFGLSVRSPVFQVAGSYEGTYERSVMGNGADDEAIIENGTGDFHTAPPIRLALGAGVVVNRLTLELDGVLNVPTQNALRAKLDVARSRRTDTGIERTQRTEYFGVPSHVTFNPSLGAELSLNPGLSLLAGVSANFSALGALHPTDSVGNLAQARTHHVNAAVGIGSYWDNGELLFGLQLDYGWGEAMALNPYALPNRFAVIDAHSYSILFVLSGSSTLKAIVRTVNKIAGAGD